MSLLRKNRTTHDLKMLVCRNEDGAIAGGININNIVQGVFQSAHLGYRIGKAVLAPLPEDSGALVGPRAPGAASGRMEKAYGRFANLTLQPYAGLKEYGTGLPANSAAMTTST